MVSINFYSAADLVPNFVVIMTIRLVKTQETYLADLNLVVITVMTFYR